ncbi:MAG: hypothetical protein D6798_16005 [Deltaproteobacteria bacterium]|nr:MAG: hypothetical protein D6798_16005 [Deltaproteobacteria bacterium]
MNPARRLLWSLTLIVAWSCGGDLTPIPGTTTRVGKPTVEPGTELELKIFTTEADCVASVNPEDYDRCLPHVDRRAGQVRLGFQFRLDSTDFPIPLAEDNLRVIHKGRVVQDGPGMSVEVIPHDPLDAAQLFILVIDASSSMAERNAKGRTRMDRVRMALLTDEVRSAFFPKGGTRTGVVLLTFTSGDPQPVGGKLEILTTPGAFTRKVKNELQVQSGYTHLYDAVRYATGPLLEVPEIKEFVDINEAAPTVVVLTDGFNNQAASDTCATNADRLERLLEHLRTVRQETEDIRFRPTVFTVGLGRPLRPNFKLPDGREPRVRAVDLCGRRFRDSRIDGQLELLGIDNASLEFIADRGGGFSYVRQGVQGLAEAFRSAAAQRYGWFEVRYHVDPHYLRRSFETRLRLLSYANAEASVRIYPSAWLDAPPGRSVEDGRIVSQPFRHTATVVMPILGLLVTLGFIGAVGFNTRRILFGRARRPRRSAPSSSTTPPPTGEVPR